MARHPGCLRTRCDDPASTDPFPMAAPLPVPWSPNIIRPRRSARDLHLRFGRSFGDNFGRRPGPRFPHVARLPLRAACPEKHRHGDGDASEYVLHGHTSTSC